MNGEFSILIVDDTPDMIDTLGEILKMYLIRAVTSGEKALKLAFGEKQPDLILLDIVMPGISGFEVCRILKDHPKTKNIPVIFITAIDKGQDEVKGFQYGAVDYITKPFSPATVLARVQTHLELKRHHDHLEELVKERTNQLIHADRLATLGSMTASVAHEIRNPLSAILSNIQIIYKRLTENYPKNQLAAKKCNTTLDTIKAYVEERDLITSFKSISASAERMDRILHNMLTFSRKSEPKLEPNNLEDLLEKAIELLTDDRAFVKETNFNDIVIHREYCASMPKISCEPSRMEQVFLNILKNGTQAMADYKRKNKEKPQFTLRLKKQDAYVLVEIEDNGPGMNKTTQKRIFEPFFTTKSIKKGTGLGLSICETIIKENHNGSLFVESNIGKGTKFTIKLPMI